MIPKWLSVSFMASMTSWERDHEVGSKGLTLFSKCSLSRRNMICAAMVESIVLDCLLITRPKRDHTRSEGAEVGGMDRKRRARRARRGNSGSSAFHWTSGCDCGAYHGRKGAAWLNQCASSHCTSRSSLTSFFSSTCMSPSMSIAGADRHRHVFFSYAAARLACEEDAGDCASGRCRWSGRSAPYRVAILLFHVAGPPALWGHCQFAEQTQTTCSCSERNAAHIGEREISLCSIDPLSVSQHDAHAIYNKSTRCMTEKENK